MNKPIISVQNVSMTFESQRNKEQFMALKNVSFDIAEREFICILGSSGCGKTTLLNIMGGFLKPTSGSLLIEGMPVERPVPRYLSIFQDYKLLPWRTVRKNIELGFEAAKHKLPQSEIDRRVDEQIKSVGLVGFEDYSPTEISGGMKQRVAIARALVLEPKILFMDEPFGALDTMTRDDLRRYFRTLLKKTGQTVVMVTHNLNEALSFADKVIIMHPNPGRIVSIVDVDLPELRDIHSEELRALRLEVYNALIR